VGLKCVFFTLREEHRLRIFDIGVLRIFGTEIEAVIGDWGQLHEDDGHEL
jgi:hypothetical protein